MPDFSCHVQHLRECPPRPPGLGPTVRLSEGEVAGAAADAERHRARPHLGSITPISRQRWWASRTRSFRRCRTRGYVEHLPDLPGSGRRRFCIASSRRASARCAPLASMGRRCRCRIHRHGTKEAEGRKNRKTLMMPFMVMKATLPSPDQPWCGASSRRKKTHSHAQIVDGGPLHVPGQCQRTMAARGRCACPEALHARSPLGAQLLGPVDSDVHEGVDDIEPAIHRPTRRPTALVFT